MIAGSIASASVVRKDPVGSSYGGGPNPQQRAQERSTAYPLVADTGILLAIYLVALLSGSLTLMSEAMRMLIMLIAGYWTLWCMMAVHRDSLRRYRFGTDKFEYLATGLCGIGLIAGGLLVAEGVVNLLFVGREVTSPAGLALAAIVNATNVLINVLGWVAMVQSSTDRNTEAFRAQLRVRVTLLMSSGAVQITLTAAALAKDPFIVGVLDATGASFVAVLVLTHGWRMVRRSIPVLLDRAASPATHRAIAAAVRRSLPEAALHSVQTRRTGNGHVARVTVLADPDLPANRLRTCATVVEETLSGAAEALQVSVMARMPAADIDRRAVA